MSIRENLRPEAGKHLQELGWGECNLVEQSSRDADRSVSVAFEK